MCVWIFFRWDQVWCTHSWIWLDNHSWYKQSGNVSCFLSLDLIAQARLARRSLCLWLHSFWFLNVPQKYIVFPLTALQKFRSWCFSPKLNLSRELCELWCRRCRAIKANPKSQCMGLSLICSGYPMSGSKGPHHGPIFIIDAYYIYIYCIHLWHLRHPTVGCWKDSGKHRGLARRLWPPRRLGPSHHILLSGCSRSVALSHPGIPWHHMAPSFARTSHLHQSFQSKAGIAAGKPRLLQIKECSVSSTVMVYTSCTVWYRNRARGLRDVEGLLWLFSSSGRLDVFAKCIFLSQGLLCDIWSLPAKGRVSCCQSARPKPQTSLDCLELLWHWRNRDTARLRTAVKPGQG